MNAEQGLADDSDRGLLNDGTRTFTYDQANRATQIISGTNTYAFAYNGLSDRISQTVNSVLTRYTLDPAAGLTQVLADGTSTYLYGAGSIAQQQTNMQYFGADGLGSVRQLYNSSGQIVANHRYDPFGNTISQSGVGTSNYGFTGEWTDGTGLEYLRARYYAPTQGRFVTRDVWAGDYRRPLRLNKWAYGMDNPVRYTDPTGYIAQTEEADADSILTELKTRYAVLIAKDYGVRQVYSEFTGFCDQWFEGAWKGLVELRWTQKAISEMATTLGGEQKFKSAMRGPVSLVRLSITKDPFPIIGVIRPFAPPGKILGDVDLPDYTFVSESYATFSIVHELAHVWDRRSSLQPSIGLSQFIGTERCTTWYSEYAGEITSCWFDTTAGREAPTGETAVQSLVDWRREYAATDAMEDWAETIASVVYPSYYGRAGQPLGPLRRQYVQDQIRAIP